MIDPAWPRAIVGTLYDGSYERVEADVLRATLRPGDLYLEVGAAIGVTTTLACQILGAPNVTAVEAIRRSRRSRGRRRHAMVSTP